MKRIWLLIGALLALAPLRAQNTNGLYSGTAQTLTYIQSQYVLAPLPQATITVCNYPATQPSLLLPCTNLALLYSGPTTSTPAASAFAADQQGNFSFWALPGYYTYTVTNILTNVTTGPYSVVISSGSSGGSGGATFPFPGLVFATNSIVGTVATSSQIATALNTSPSTQLAPSLLPTATTSTLGIVRPDGVSITINPSTGVLSSTPPTVSIPSTALVLKGANLPNVAAAALPGTDYVLPTGSITGSSASLSAASTLPNGTVATTQPLGDNTTKLATDAFVLANAPGGATTPATLLLLKGNNSINGVVAALPGTDYVLPSGTVANLSGTPTLPNGTSAATQSPGDNTTKLATDAFVLANGGAGAIPATTSVLKGSGSLGSAVAATPGTDYLAPGALPATASLLKGSGSVGSVATAVPGTDYLSPNTTATMNPLGTATSGGNFSSNLLRQSGSFWTGSVAAADIFTWQDVLGTGTNPANTYTLTHAGSPGASLVSLGALPLTTTGAVTALSYATSGASSGAVALSGSTSGTTTVTVPATGTSYALTIPSVQPTAGNTFLSCTAANPSLCTWTAGGGSLAFPETVSGTTTSGGIPYFSAATTLSSSGILNTNILVKGGGTGGAPSNSSITDNATTVTTTDTGGIVSPVFTASGTTAGFIDLPQGTTSSAVAPCNAATSLCIQAPASVTSYVLNLPGAQPTGGNTFLSCTAANPSVCSWTAGGGGGGSAFPVTVSGTVTSGGIPYFSSTTNEATSGLLTQFGVLFGGGAGGAPTSSAQGGSNFPLIGQGAANPIFSTIAYPTSLTSGGFLYASSTTAFASSALITTNVLPKSGGAGTAPLASSITDNGTTVTSTDTGGITAPVFTATGTTAGFMDFPQGTTSSAVAPCNAATSVCIQAPTSVTSYLLTLPAAAPTANNLALNCSTSGVCSWSGGTVARGTGTYTTATSDAITVTGATASSICTFSPTNSTAAASTVVGFISSVTTNSVTITHVATTASGGTVNVVCTLN